MKYILGLDIGGTHIAGALADRASGDLLTGSYHKNIINTGADSHTVLTEWAESIRNILKEINGFDLAGIGIAMPGPFDYENGVSLIKGLGKYDALYGMNIGVALKELLHLPENFPVYFKNDAACFGLGEEWKGAAAAYQHVTAITLGTGLGAAFIKNGEHVQQGNDIPPGGTLYQIPYDDSIAEDHFSARGLLKDYALLKGEQLEGVKIIYERANRGEPEALQAFEGFGKKLAGFLTPWLCNFKAQCLVLGGSISRASCFFIEEMKKEFSKNSLPVKVIHSSLGDKAAILGAVRLFRDNKKKEKKEVCRKADQFLLPVIKDSEPPESYDIYPAFHLKDGKIYKGIDSLAAYIVKQKTVLIDGYAGVFWNKLKEELKQALPGNVKISIRDTGEWLLPEDRIKDLVTPYLGEEDSIWGTRCDKSLSDFFDKEKIEKCQIDREAEINIIWGTGAALCRWDVPVIYVDLPKNELQYRMRAGSITNLGCHGTGDPVQMYKQFYFVDWVVLNKHKKNILSNIKIIVDNQRPDVTTWMYFNDLKDALKIMARNVFRVRPWFEPGAWGGQWIKKNIKGVNRDVVNYAWSFELITPENGLLLESSGLLLEVSFDFLMFTHNEDVLGKENTERFGHEFPIRFDFLDTVGGGDLSVQCHPSVAYIRKHFGENFTQDETYYILDAEDDAGVYLGFRENIDPAGFRKVLEQSNENKQPVKITDYVQYYPAKKHDLFLIPNGTVHSAGGGNLVLEISATPYIFTFKMYDWLRMDLNGNPRPINIEHAFNNLDFDRKGERVKATLISKPSILNSGPGWKQIHLPTHRDHFYDVHRYEFNKQVTIDTERSCNILMLVEGSSVIVETKNGFKQRFRYAETFVIPAGAESYTLTNEGRGEAKVVKAFLK